ncbi:MAG: hypothetical protein EPN84_05665 [Legionella sp.]|nr:MAG: hypothetical protein EPN84_05665 [Legionella sp.]
MNNKLRTVNLLIASGALLALAGCQSCKNPPFTLVKDNQCVDANGNVEPATTAARPAAPTGLKVTVGGNIGGGQSSTTTGLASTGTGHNPATIVTYPQGGNGQTKSNSVVGGVQAAVTVPVSKAFVGAEVAAGGSDYVSSRTGITPALGSLGQGIVNQDVKLNSSVTAAAIAGVSVTDTVDFYAKGGWAGAGANFSSSVCLENGAICNSTSSNDFINGYVAGAGVNYNATPNVSFGAEYQHFEFDTQNLFAAAVVNGALTPTATTNSSFKTTQDVGVLKVNVKVNA